MTGSDGAPEVATALYQFFADDGELLYIGITEHPRTRWGQHSRDKEWWGRVERREVTWYPNRALAADAEARAIRERAPLHNHTHKQSPLVGGLERTPDWTFRDTPSYHRQMATHLRQLIIEGEAAAGDRYPTTSELARYYGVSTVTVQNALLELKEIGFAVGRPGKAVYVAIPRPVTAKDARSIGTAAGDLTLMWSGLATPSVRVLAAMGLPSGETIPEQRWLRHDSGAPVEYIREFSLREGVTTKTVDRLRTLPPTTEVVRALELHRDATVLTILRVALDADGLCLGAQLIAKHGDDQGVTYEF